MRQQRLLLLRIRFGDQRAAMAVGHGDKASGHVITEERESGGMATVSHRQGAAFASAVLRIGKRRLRAPKAMFGRSMPLCGIEDLTVSLLTLPPLGTTGSLTTVPVGERNDPSPRLKLPAE